ncbi:MAG TPA: hypothetical protein VHB20_01155 [Verrucomicrobiae bacterium]|jgi:Tfp pilus assembly protein PilO|nr:hypothetical protein [Verrucomicrobiae bacterium]
MKNTTFLDQLNLRPQEKRIVFAIMVIVFLVLNIVMVWPHFSDWGRIKKELDATSGKLRAQTNEIGRDVEATNGYKRQLAHLERDQKGGISQVFDEALQLQKTVSAQASKCGVDIINRSPGTASTAATNDFFDEQILNITFQAEETSLVNFLYNVGNDPSMVRIREIHLDPADAGRFKLKGSIMLAANYQKRAPAPAPAAAAPRPGTILPKPLPNAPSPKDAKTRPPATVKKL